MAEARNIKFVLLQGSTFGHERHLASTPPRDSQLRPQPPGHQTPRPPARGGGGIDDHGPIALIGEGTISTGGGRGVRLVRPAAQTPPQGNTTE